jgi:hypothetical protein
MASNHITIDGIEYAYDSDDTLESLVRKKGLGGCQTFALTSNQKWDNLKSFVSPKTLVRDSVDTLFTHPVRLNGIPFWVSPEEGTTPVTMDLSYSFTSEEIPSLVMNHRAPFTVTAPSVQDIEDFVRQYLTLKDRHSEGKPVFEKKKLKVAYQFGNKSTDIQFIRPGGSLVFKTGTILDHLASQKDSGGSYSQKNTFKYSQEGEKAFSVRINWENWVNKDLASVGPTEGERHVLDDTYPVNPSRASSGYRESLRVKGLRTYDFRSSTNPSLRYRMFFSQDDQQYHVSAGTFSVYEGNPNFEDEVAEDPDLQAYLDLWRPNFAQVPRKSRYDCSCEACREGRPQECSIGT